MQYYGFFIILIIADFNETAIKLILKILVKIIVFYDNRIRIDKFFLFADAECLFPNAEMAEDVVQHFCRGDVAQYFSQVGETLAQVFRHNICRKT